jgi:hypothetical protein
LNALPDGFKAAVFDELVRRLVAAHRDGESVPLRLSTGEVVGTLLFHRPEAAAADEYYTQLPAPARAEMMRPLVEFDWDNCLTDEQVNALVSGAGRSPTPG